jgi:uncharacterized membrane protein
MKVNTTEKRLERIEAKIDQVMHALGIAPEQLAKAQELAKKLKEARDSALQAALEARRGKGMANPDEWTPEDEFASQMT